MKTYLVDCGIHGYGRKTTIVSTGRIVCKDCYNQSLIVEPIDSSNYVEKAKRTDSVNFAEIRQRVNASDKTIKLLHAGLGMSTESGEFVDVVKKYLFYGKQIDETNLVEELGDLLWYVAVACDALGVELEKVMHLNIEKLKARYGDKFTDTKALDRNLDKERKVLEGKDNA